MIMPDITWMAGSKRGDYDHTWDDLHYETKEKAIEAAKKIAEEFGGIPVIEKVEWRK